MRKQLAALVLPLVLVGVAAAGPAAADTSAPTVITFDDFTGTVGPLTDQYASQGVNFARTNYWTILNPTYSPHSGGVVVFPENGGASGPIVVTFKSPQPSVGGWMSGAGSGWISCADVNGALLETSRAALPEEYKYLSVSAPGIRSCSFDGIYDGVRKGDWVLDDLTFGGRGGDSTAPQITPAVDPATPDGQNGWYTSSPSISFSVTDPDGPMTTENCAPTTVGVDTAGITVTCSATSAGGAASSDVTVKRDATAPSVAGPDVIDTAWRNSPLTKAFTASDALSGLSDPADAAFGLTATLESASPTSTTRVSRAVMDNAGNTTTRTVSALIDRTKPVPSLVGGPVNGGTYTPAIIAPPTCAATDALSGVASCTLSGYSAGSGAHTVTATATDRAGNVATVSSNYTVRGKMTSTGFHAPVDMGGVYNVVKGGSTVPLKFNVLIDGVRRTATSVVTRFTATPTSCSSSASVDDVEMLTTGGTALRYDGTQFVQNWQTPTGAGTCYRATATLSGASTISALFKIK